MSYLGISRLNWLCVVFIFDRHGEHCQAWWKSCYDLRVFLLSCIYKLTKGYLNETIYIWCCLCLHCLLRRAGQLPTGISNHCIGHEWSIIVWYLFQNRTSYEADLEVQAWFLPELYIPRFICRSNFEIKNVFGELFWAKKSVALSINFKKTVGNI